MKDFVEECQFRKAWDTFHIDFTHYQDRIEGTHTSTVDHIFWNEESHENVCDAGVVHIPENTSDHCPVYCVVKTGKMEISSNPSNIPSPPKPSWKKASPEEKAIYKTNLEVGLSSINLPESLTSCRDVHCSNPSHSDDADKAIIDILECIEKTSFDCLPVPLPSKKKKSENSIPGWSAEVAPYCELAHFWHQVWMSAGRPLNTDLHQTMKRSRNVYHYQVRKLKKSKDTIKRNKLLDACINGDGDLFTEIKKIRNTNACSAESIDGVTEGVSDHFKTIYEQLYNSV